MTLTVVAHLPILVAAAGDTTSVVLVRHGADWSAVLDQAIGTLRDDELELLLTASADATSDVVLHSELPEAHRGRLRIFCTEE